MKTWRVNVALLWEDGHWDERVFEAKAETLEAAFDQIEGAHKGICEFRKVVKFALMGEAD